MVQIWLLNHVKLQLSITYIILFLQATVHLFVVLHSFCTFYLWRNWVVSNATTVWVGKACWVPYGGWGGCRRREVLLCEQKSIHEALNATHRGFFNILIQRPWQFERSNMRIQESVCWTMLLSSFQCFSFTLLPQIQSSKQKRNVHDWYVETIPDSYWEDYIFMRWKQNT